VQHERVRKGSVGGPFEHCSGIGAGRERSNRRGCAGTDELCSLAVFE
jgi:hypothetical protein